MATITRGTRGRVRRRRTRRWHLPALWPGKRRRQRWWRAFRRASGTAQVLTLGVCLALVALGVNWIYQASRKPSELLFPVSGVLYKTPSETWSQYAPLFEKYSTPTMSPELLAAIAQVEGSGNPIVRTYWRWSWGGPLFEIYRPASSAVGMFQITDGTFSESKRYCIRDHAVVEDGPWHDLRSCWFNSLYARVFPGDAIELTSAYLDHHVALIVARGRHQPVPLPLRQQLAAVIHLCGAGAGEAFAGRGYRLTEGQRCGDHDVRAYVARIDAMRRLFATIEAQSR